MKEVLLSEALTAEVASIYAAMEADYDTVAKAIKFSCDGCPDNCCDSYFQHHTYSEWAYLFQGFREQSEVKQQEIIERSRRYILDCTVAEAKDERPQVMCPLNEEGRCILYKHRLKIGRAHV